MKPTVALALLPLVALLGLGACGGGQAEAPARTAAPVSASATPASSAPATPDSSGNGASPATDPAPARATTGNWPFAAPSADERKQQLERLEKDAGPIKTNWVPPGRNARYGHAEALIAAEYDVVRARLADYPHYHDLAGPKFKKVSVVDKQPTGTDLYFQLPIMKGLVTIWYVARFPEPKRVGPEMEVIEGAFVKGNIKGMHLVFTVRPESNKTVLTCDLLLSLNMAAPEGELDQALRDACGDAVRQVRTHTAPKPAP